MTALVPKTALLEENGQTHEVPAGSLALRSIIVVRPGDRVPAHGLIVEGGSSIDESPVTGESVPKRKTVGDLVFAGTINADAVLRVRVTAAASDNTIARVVKLVEEAQESKAPTERFIDRFAKVYTPGVLVIGALVAIVPPLMFGQPWSAWIYKGLAVLLIGCPCALVISTPAAIAAGLSAGARRGLLLKGGAVLEGLRKITTVALDKTGTLTDGSEPGWCDDQRDRGAGLLPCRLSRPGFDLGDEAGPDQHDDGLGIITGGAFSVVGTGSRCRSDRPPASARMVRAVSDRSLAMMGLLGV